MNGPLEIIAQTTPNPNAAKFVLSRTVATQGVTYRDAAAAEAEWAKQLLGIPGITQVFALNNFIAVTKQPDADWNVVGPQVERMLREAFGP